LVLRVLRIRVEPASQDERQLDIQTDGALVGEAIPR